MDALVTTPGADDSASDGLLCDTVAGADSSAAALHLLSPPATTQRNDDAISASARAADYRSDALDDEESNHSLKLQHEKLVAELNAKDLLLTRKRERIDELLQQLHARDTQLEAVNTQLQTHTAQCALLQRDLATLQDQLRKDEDDFAVVAATLAAQEQATAARTQDVAAARAAERAVRTELDTALGVIRRLEKAAQQSLPPETADASLSPRSFSEHQLIALRDDAIAARTKEVWLLAGQNATLRGQLDDRDTAIEQLERLAQTAENDSARHQRRIDTLKRENDALLTSQREADGRERAMAIATTQNRTLLVALEAQERVSADLEERATRAERECEQLRVAHTTLSETAAANDVDVLYRTREADERNAIVRSLQDKLQRERKALQTELANAQLQHQVAVETMQRELVMRRTKQYELTLQLQDADARLHNIDSEADAMREQLFATTSRMHELERVLTDALQWKQQLEAQVAALQMDAAAADASSATQLQTAQNETVALTTQLAELKDALVQRSGQIQRLERDVRDAKMMLETKDAHGREQRERIARLVREVNREAQTRAELELERQVLREQLETLRQQTESAQQDVDVQRRRSDDKLQRFRDVSAQLETDLANERAGKAKLIARLAEAFIAASTMASTGMCGGNVAVRSSYSTTTNSGSTWASNESYDLRECALGDQDLPPLLRMLEHAPDALTRVDLRSNRLTQDGMRAVASFAKKLAAWLSASNNNNNSSSGNDASDSRRHHCRIRDLDLRHNYVALDGVRTVASSIESLIGGALKTNQSLSSSSNSGSSGAGSQTTTIRRVVVKSGGRIECFVDAAKPEYDAATMSPVLIVDLSANFDADVLATEARKLQRRRGRESDYGASGVASPSPHPVSTHRDQLLAATYGADLVSSLLGGSDSSAAATSIALPRRRRSSLQFDKSKPAALLLPVAALPTGAAAASQSPRDSTSMLSTQQQQQRTLTGSSSSSAATPASDAISSSTTRLLGSASLPKLSG